MFLLAGLSLNQRFQETLKKKTKIQEKKNLDVVHQEILSQDISVKTGTNKEKKGQKGTKLGQIGTKKDKYCQKRTCSNKIGTIMVKTETTRDKTGTSKSPCKFSVPSSMCLFVSSCPCFVPTCPCLFLFLLDPWRHIWSKVHLFQPKGGFEQCMSKAY